MAIIRTMKSFLGRKIYPKTVTKAIYDEDGNRLDVVLSDMIKTHRVVVFDNAVGIAGSTTKKSITIDKPTDFHKVMQIVPETTHWCTISGVSSEVVGDNIKINVDVDCTHDNEFMSATVILLYK